MKDNYEKLNSELNISPDNDENISIEKSEVTEIVESHRKDSKNDVKKDYEYPCLHFFINEK